MARSVRNTAGAPNPSSQKVQNQPYAALCPTFLAQPMVREVRTEESWDPILEDGRIVPRSLRELGRRRERNQRIVHEYMRGHANGEYRRTLIFCCGQLQADLLARLLGKRNVAARAIHSGHTSQENADAIHDFREGAISVLLAVEMTTTGLDVPEIDSIFLTRPTASLTLLAQMIGRGSRRTNKKRYVIIVEFTDNVARLGDKLFHASDYVGPARHSPGVPRRQGAPTRHNEPIKAPRFRNLAVPDLGTLSFAEGQTFGVEIELTSRRKSDRKGQNWGRAARQIIQRLQDCATLPVHSEPVKYHGYEDALRWYVSSDSSAGWEVVSPILVNEDGFDELIAVCRGLDSRRREPPLSYQPSDWFACHSCDPPERF